MTNLDHAIAGFVSGIRPLAIPRLEDLPYVSSPPIQFVYQSTAALALGLYVWNDPPQVLTPNRPILTNAIYFFRNVTLAADISPIDFSAAIVTTPQFYMFRQGDARAVLFREPLQMPMFLDQFDYRLCWLSQQQNDQLFAAFRGSLVQTPNLIGKTSITLKAIITAQEIADKNYVESFKSAYPHVNTEGVQS